jgi:hypothetical protein
MRWHHAGAEHVRREAVRPFFTHEGGAFEVHRRLHGLRALLHDVQGASVCVILCVLL